MEKNVKKEAWLHFCVSSIGGFMGAYAIINHCDLLASSQTSNMIHIVHNLFEPEHSLLIYMVLAALVYACGNVTYVLLHKFIKLDTKIISLGLTSVAFILVSVLNFVENSYLAMLPLFFAAPIQWNAYAGDAGYGSSTFFSTNNIRQTVTSLTSYLIDGDIKMKHKAQFFGMTLLFFHIGGQRVCGADRLKVIQGPVQAFHQVHKVGVPPAGIISCVLYVVQRGKGIFFRQKVGSFRIHC